MVIRTTFDGTILPHHPFDPRAPSLATNIPVLVGCTEYEATLLYLRDEAAFSLDEAALRPGSTPSDVFFRVVTDRRLVAGRAMQV